MMRLKLATVIVGLALLGACSSSSEQSGNTAGQGAGGPGGGVTREALAQLQDQLTRVGDRVFFETDRWELMPAGQQTIQGWAQLLRQNAGANVIIEGHADERGTREYNLALGERRAATARDYLVSLGIDARRIRTISYGKERPAIAESNPDGWAQNRRAVIVVQGIATS
jgi:peptidoglycan-associated lipoprotein